MRAVNKDAEYRNKAVECAEAAESAHDLVEHLALLKMAQAWIKLAEHARAHPNWLPAKHRHLEGRLLQVDESKH